MPTIQTHRQSDLEKRLKTLESQLYGKKPAAQYISKSVSIDQQEVEASTHQNTDILYLKQDLTKILIFSSFAIGIQLVLYFSQVLNRVKLF